MSSRVQRTNHVKVPLLEAPVIRLKKILLIGDLGSVRLCLSLAALLWAIMLYWPGDTFARPTYTLMGYIMGETCWATLFLLQGMVMLTGLLYDYKDRFVMLADGVMGCVLWSGCTITMLLSVYPPPAAISAEIAMAVASWWNLVRFLADGVD